MRSEIWALAVIVGACNWAFRYFPTRMDLSKLPEKGQFARFLAATGPAAIATLFVASVLPSLKGQQGDIVALACGTAAVLGGYAATRSVVAATLAGSLGFGAAVAILSA